MAPAEIVKPTVMIFDATSSGSYLDRASEGAAKADWLVKGYDNEQYALEDLEDGVGQMANALILGLPKARIKFYAGSTIVAKSNVLSMPRAIISLDDDKEGACRTHRDAFIPGYEMNKIPERVSEWLIMLAGGKQSI